MQAGETSHRKYEALMFIEVLAGSFGLLLGTEAPVVPPLRHRLFFSSFYLLACLQQQQLLILLINGLHMVCLDVYSSS